MMKKTYTLLLITGLSLGLIQCGQDGAALSSGGPEMGIPVIDESPDISSEESVALLPAAVVSTTPENGAEDLDPSNLAIKIKFTAPPSDLQIHVLQKASSDVFYNLAGTHGYNASTNEAQFSPDEGFGKGHYYIVNLAWKALPQDEETLQHTFSFFTVAASRGNNQHPGPGDIILDDNDNGGVVEVPQFKFPKVDIVGGKDNIPSAKDLIDREKWDLIRKAIQNHEYPELSGEEAPARTPPRGCNDPRVRCTPDQFDFDSVKIIFDGQRMGTPQTQPTLERDGFGAQDLNQMGDFEREHAPLIKVERNSN